MALLVAEKMNDREDAAPAVASSAMGRDTGHIVGDEDEGNDDELTGYMNREHV